MSMNMIEIERALRSLRLSGIRATLETRVLQAQANQEPFLDTCERALKSAQIWVLPAVSPPIRPAIGGDHRRAPSPSCRRHY